MFGISLEGESQPLFSLERDGNQRVSVCRLRFFDQFLIIADKHSLVSSSLGRGGAGGGGDALVIRVRSRCRGDWRFHCAADRKSAQSASAQLFLGSLFSPPAR